MAPQGEGYGFNLLCEEVRLGAGTRGPTLPEKVGVFHSSARKVVPIYPNASYALCGRRRLSRGVPQIADDQKGLAGCCCFKGAPAPHHTMTNNCLGAPGYDVGYIPFLQGDSGQHAVWCRRGAWARATMDRS